MTDFRISYRNGDLRAARWVPAENVDEAIRKFRGDYRSNDIVVSISKRCGAPTLHGSTCQRLTTTGYCPAHQPAIPKFYRGVGAQKV